MCALRNVLTLANAHVTIISDISHVFTFILKLVLYVPDKTLKLERLLPNCCSGRVVPRGLFTAPLITARTRARHGACSMEDHGPHCAVLQSLCAARHCQLVSQAVVDRQNKESCTAAADAAAATAAARLRTAASCRTSNRGRGIRRLPSCAMLSSTNGRKARWEEMGASKTVLDKDDEIRWGVGGEQHPPPWSGWRTPLAVHKQHSSQSARFPTTASPGQ